MDDKNFTTFEEQIEILKRRNLKFNSEETALTALKRYGYYSIINGYKDPYVEIIDGEDHYKSGVTFEQIYSLYTLDRQIRNQLMAAMLEVEDTLRAAVAHTLGEAFTADQNLYLKRSNFRLGKKRNNKYQLDDILKKFHKIENDNVQPIRYYRETYGNIPPWILMKGASFGNLVNFIKLQKGPQKNKIISLVYNIPLSLVETSDDVKNVFMDTLFVCLDYRNRAAHGGRIYNHKTDATFRFTPLLHTHLLKISEGDYRVGKGVTDLMTLTAAIGFMDNRNPCYKLRSAMDYFTKEHCDIYPNDLDYLKKYIAVDY